MRDSQLMMPMAGATPKPARVPAFGEITRYAVVSALSLLLDFGVMAMLVHWAAWPAVGSSAAGFACGMVLAYGLSSRWAFRRHDHREGWRGLLVFSLIGGGGLLINSGLVWVGMAMAGLAWPLAKLCAAAGSFAFNYTLRKRVLYRRSAQGERTR